jgi:hypothetical protein
MDRQDFLNRFGLNQHTAFHEQIEAKRFFAAESLVIHSNHLLVGAREPAQFQFLRQAPLVNRFEQTGPLSRCTSIAAAMIVSVNPHARSYRGCMLNPQARSIERNKGALPHASPLNQQGMHAKRGVLSNLANSEPIVSPDPQSGTRGQFGPNSRVASRTTWLAGVSLRPIVLTLLLPALIFRRRLKLSALGMSARRACGESKVLSEVVSLN